VFDVGETLVDETRIWSSWADWLGVPRLTFLALLGGVVARGGEHREVFGIIRPNLDLHAEIARRAEVGITDEITPADLYPDAVPCLDALCAAGYRVAVVGNQPTRTEAVIRALPVPLEFVASSASWQVRKPSPAFFERIVAELGLPPQAIAYVGDRVDNDVEPAAAAGLRSVFVRRGPWGWIQAGESDPPAAAIVVDSLAALPEALERLV